ncbi:CS-domain-containing protein [Microstroma glucosiphilum]|uniref:CS-domain-containing protein n=1 Tax=Pseudomicrostroma glucosiphilum TaxID=1684307 RepID=A0A316U974_9BASI|nr:CS-domain-containing protein [Pseudomicrostroma glucosiphilum]PWN21388.1 CS-domain-containing protein [Pseudomicrostroma glucosiphilum]
MTSSQPRYDYYQTDTAVNLSVFVKGLTENDVDIKFGEHSLSLTLHSPSAPPQSLELQLHDDIDGSNSSFKVLSTKVDILLKKKLPGRRWPNLEAQAGGAGE